MFKLVSVFFCFIKSRHSLLFIAFTSKKWKRASSLKNLKNSFEKIKEPKETGDTFASNAKIKSKYGQKLFNVPCFADDSGFCVEALKNNPGVKSKRFLEKFSNNKKAFEYIISNVINKKNNKAFFVTAISLTLKQNHHIIFLGKINGTVTLEPKGSNGFGYDSIFLPRGYKITFGQMKKNQKIKIDHRQKAFIKLRKKINIL